MYQIILKMKLKHFKTFIISFILYFSIIVLVYKYTGSVNRFTTAYIEPYSWSQIKTILPNIAIVSIIAGVFSTLLIEEGNKQKKKDMESARKRIEEKERERKEKEQNEKGSKSDNQDKK